MAERYERTGISYTTHRRLRAGGSNLHAETRRKILAYLSRTDGIPGSEKKRMLELVGELRDVADRMEKMLKGRGG